MSTHEPDAHVSPGAHQLTSQQGSDASPQPSKDESRTDGASHVPAVQVAPSRHHDEDALKMHLSSPGNSAHVQHACATRPHSGTHVHVSGTARDPVNRANTRDASRAIVVTCVAHD